MRNSLVLLIKERARHWASNPFHFLSRLSLSPSPAPSTTSLFLPYFAHSTPLSFSLSFFLFPPHSPLFAIPHLRVLTMSQPSCHQDVAEMIYRLKTRLALANFKRQYGYEKYDLHTLESSLLLRCHQEHIRQYQLQNPFLKKKKDQVSLPDCYRRHYYPPSSTSTAAAAAAAVTGRTTTALPPKISKMSVTRRLPMCPVSAKRSTSPRFPPKQRPPSKIAATAVHRFVHDHALPFSSDEEDAANLLVMLHNHA